MEGRVTTVLGDRRYVTDGGLETDLIFHHGVGLPEFAAFPLVEQAYGRELLAHYYDGYADVARRAGAGLMLEAPTWRANPDWGALLGYDADALDRVNRASIEFLHERRDAHADLHDVGILVGGMIGPRGDGYVPGDRLSLEGYADYHRPQLASFQAAGADLATALTLVGADEAIGIVAAAREVGLPIAVAFTVETDGRLAGGSSLREAVDEVDAAGGPDWFLVNCAHPTHVAPGLGDGGPWARIAGFRPNASRMSHAELDEAEELDEGDPAELRASYDAMADRLPELQVLGGCCGTDARHVAALWGV
jgi:homocysteine S-methyltransferase